MTDTPAEPAMPRPMSRARRWLRRIVLTVVAVALLFALIVQIILWTDLPRGIVVRQIEQQLGLRLSVKSLSTGWLGHTELHDVTITLPLADKAFLDVPVMKVKNTSLFGLLLGKSVELQAIELDQPHLTVRQDSTGRWNLQDVSELLMRIGGQSAATSETPFLPNLHLVGGVVSVIDNQNRSAQIEPLAVDGYRDTAVSWKYDVQIPPRLSITGRLVPGGNWGHDAAIKLQDVSAWATPWMKDFPQLLVDVNWRGQFTNAGVDGSLEIHKITADLKTGPAEVYGLLSASLTGAGLTVNPQNLLLKTGQQILPQLSVASGSINYTRASNDLKIERLLVNIFGGPAKVSADYNLNTQSAHVDAGWERLALPGNVTHSGTFVADFVHPFPNRISLKGNLTSTGRAPTGPWIVATSLTASGESFTNFDWIVNAAKAQWQRTGAGVNLDGLAMKGAMRSDTLTVASVTLPDADLLSGTGSYQFTGAQPWHATLQGQHWPFHPISGTELGFELKARGDKKNILLDNFLLKSPEARLSANGTYTYGLPKPLDVNVRITNAPAYEAPVAVAASPKARILNGTVEGNASLRGTIDPLNLDVRGDLLGREIDVRGHHLGDVDLVLSDLSHINAGGVFIYSQSLTLLGGKWGLDGIYQFDTAGLTVDVDLNDVSLKDISTLADCQDLSGALAGKFSVLVPGLNPGANNLRITPAEFKLQNVQAAGVAIDELDATLSLDNGRLELNPIRLKRGDGRGSFRASLDVSNFREINAAATISAWPIDVPGALAHMDASVTIPTALIELPNPASPRPPERKLRISAPRITLQSATTFQGEALGNLVAYAGINGREIDVRAVHMKLLDGRLDGQAHANLDSLETATAECTWEKLDLATQARIFPVLNGLTGRATGDLRLAPATDPRPREPLALVITNQFDNGAWRTIPIADGRIAAYVGPNDTATQAGWRIVLQDSSVAPSFLHVDGGTIELWGRFGFHGRANSAQAQIAFRDLDLNRAVHAFSPAAKSMPGKVAGTLLLLRAPVPPLASPSIADDQMFPSRPENVLSPIPESASGQPPLKRLIEPIYAEGHLELTRTNLLNFGPFAFLYNAANLFHNDKKAEGDGNVDFHLERGTLTVQHLRYFNRGSEIRAVATINDIWKVPQSPLNGSAFLTARPLKNLRLPFLTDFDTVLTAVQASLQLTGVKVTGTLDKYRMSQIGLSEMGQDLRNFLVGDVKGEQQTGGGG